MPARDHSIYRMVTAARNHWWLLLLQLALFAAIYVGITLYRSKDIATGVAPGFSALTLGGKQVSLTGLQGRPVLLHFWASWCGICRFEQSSIDAIARDYSVVTIATQSGSRSDVAGYVKQQAITAPVVVDEDGVLAQAYGIRGFPTTLIIDSTGTIRNLQIGYTSEWGLRARLWYYTKHPAEGKTNDG